MKLTDYGSDLCGLGHRIDEMRLAQESLAFCLRVYREYNSPMLGQRLPPNEHMDADKARNQLLDAIDRILKV
jgi:hypothetical protein